MSGTETVAVVVVTYNRADLLVGMLDGLAAQTRRPDAVIVIDNASTDHTRAVLDAPRPTCRCTSPRPRRNLGGAGGFHLGVRAAYDAGCDRVWLMDDDVVPAPDCLAVADGRRRGLPHRGARGPRPAHLVEKAAIRFDLRNPLAIRPKTRQRRLDVRRPRDHAGAGRGRRTSPSRASWCAASVVDRDRLPRPGVLHLLRRRRLRDPRPQGRASASGRCATRVLVRQLDFNQQHDLSGWKGFYMYPQPLRGALALRGERPRPAQAVADHARRGAAQPGARRPRPRRAT